ncbi:lipid II:glycine glycyltransferase FemX [Pelotomaculum propionicicum]|uniref:lipid II:glycine glycyltransferase FemX n=1 Tax=Pelotomaculum propionicicum TaxID=258475 RepID=UPI003B810B27
MGRYEVIKADSRDKWLEILEQWEGLKPDIHYRPEYCCLYRGSGEPRLFIYREGPDVVVYPFLLRRVNSIASPAGQFETELYDITTPYGYGGPLSNRGAGNSAWDNFYRSFDEYCADENIVTEFIRYHPLLENHRQADKHMEVERVSSVVYVDLQRPYEEIWAGYQRSNRKNINKARREGLEVILEEEPAHFEDFLSIYHHTMERNRASPSYYFGRDFYSLIHEDLKGCFLYAHTVRDGDVISSELLLYNETYIHSFLGGTVEEYFEYRPNNILKHEAIRWAKNRGIRYFVLGGGYHDGDGIYRYKSSFSKDGVLPFYIGKKVHNRKAMNILDQLLAPEGCPEKMNFFPRYRMAERYYHPDQAGKKVSTI